MSARNRYRVALSLAAVTAALAVAPVAAASASPYLGTGQARNYANNVALDNWNPPSWSLAYGEGWDGLNSPTSCYRFGRSSLHCVVSVNIQNYADDGYGDLTGYAYCVGTINVTKHYGGWLSGRTHGLSCDASQ